MTTMTTTMRVRRPGRPSPSPATRPTTVGGATATDGRSIAVRLPVDELSRYAGLTAFVSAVLAAAGILATIAYLSAWQVPAPILRLDPLTAALRSEVVLYQLAISGVVLVGLAAVSRRLEGRRWAGRLALGLALACIGYLAFDALHGGFVGPVVTLATGVLLFVAYRRAWLSERAIVTVMVLVSLASAAQTGYEMGVGYRDGRSVRNQLALTTTAPIGGLDGVAIDGAAWRYDGLYLVFRDGEAIFVSRPGSGPLVWVVPASRIAAVELIGTSR